MYTKFFGATLWALFVVALATASSADVTTTQGTTTTPDGSSVTVNSTIEGNPIDIVPLSMTVTMPMNLLASNTSSSSVTEFPVSGCPTYIKRIIMLREQLGDGLSKGWIGADEASVFQARLDQLSGTASSLNLSEESSPAADSLQHRINALNIDLSRRLASH